MAISLSYITPAALLEAVAKVSEREREWGWWGQSAHPTRRSSQRWPTPLCYRLQPGASHGERSSVGSLALEGSLALKS